MNLYIFSIEYNPVKEGVDFIPEPFDWEKGHRVVTLEVFVQHIRNIHSVELLADIIWPEAVAHRIVFHIKGYGRI